MQVQATGIPWYREQDYERLVALFNDGSKLPATFSQWQAKAQGLHDHLTSKGSVVVKAYIDPDTFPEWCRTHGHEMDAQARMAFGNECAYKAITGKP
jgi:hypothetical protein